MNICVITVLLLSTLIHLGQSINTTYTTKYDGVDLDEVLSNDRLLTSYINCLLDLGPCSPDGKELKNNLPDAIDNDCKKCSRKQKEGSEKVMHYIIDHRPEDWENLEKKYNANGSYKNKYLENKNEKVIPRESTSQEREENGANKKENNVDRS